MADGQVLEVVVEGHQLTRQLESYLDECCSVEDCRTTVQGILAAWEKLMSMATFIPDPKMELSPHMANLQFPEMSDTVNPLVAETYKQQLGDQDQQSQKLSKKRKADLPTWASPVPPAGSPTNFGVSALLCIRSVMLIFTPRCRSDIQSYKTFCRCYYRCSHRFTQKCPATKQIQRSEHDPSVYDVKYHGNHNCVQKSKRKSPRAADAVPADPDCGLSILQSFKMSLSVETEGLSGGDQEEPSTSASQSYWTPSFSTPSPMGADGFAFSDSFSSFSQFMSPTGAMVDETANSFWAEPILLENESAGLEVVASSAALPTAAGMESAGYALLEVDPDFPDFLSEPL